MVNLTLHLLRSFLFPLRNDSLLLDIDADKSVYAHIQVSDPHQCETGDNIPPPVGHQQLKVREHQKKNGYVVAEAVFACEKVEEFSHDNRLALPRFSNTVFMRLLEDFFMGNSPCNTSDGNSQYEKPSDLCSQCHTTDGF
jgi:hypothetical protein